MRKNKDLKMNLKNIYCIILMSLYSGQACSSLYTPSLQNELQPIDLTPISQLCHKLDGYADHDQHMKELQSALTTQQNQINKYNHLLDTYTDLTLEQQASLSDSSFQDLIKVSKIEMDNLAQLADVLMQSKNIDASWQIEKYGMIAGSFSFVKNLVLPQSWRSSLYAGVGALTGVAALQLLPKSSTNITINLPAGVDKIQLSDNTQQKLVTTAAVCALGAGTAIAVSQLYTSWMYDKNSRDILIDKIKAIKQSNGTIGQTFNSLGIHKAIGRVELAQVNQRACLDRIQIGVENLETNGVEVKANIAALTTTVGKMDAKLDTLVAALKINEKEAERLKECLQNFKGDAEQAIQLLQDQFGRDFDRMEKLIVANAMLQMSIHEENKENFQAMHTNMQSLQEQKTIQPFGFNTIKSRAQFAAFNVLAKISSDNQNEVVKKITPIDITNGTMIELD